jgi:hypothetical protein
VSAAELDKVIAAVRAEATAAERERIRLLARDSGATYLTRCPNGDCPQHDHRLPFRNHPELLAEAPEDPS